MNSLAQSSFFCSNADTITAIEEASSHTTIILDFDETLFLRNSTEEYLNSIQPRLLGAMVLFLLSFLKPWNWLIGNLRGEGSQDWIRVVVTTILFPWTPFLWRLRAKSIAEYHANTVLLQSLKDKKGVKIVIATQGFGFIVEPILQHFDISIERTIACRFLEGGTDRQRGKKILLTEALGDFALKDSVVVTDSMDDLPLLESVAKPCLTQWPEAKYFRAMGDLYIPFFYIERVKQPGENYLVKVIVAEDLLFVTLSTSWLSSNPIIHAVSMTFLMASFWCIYEIGYMENDLIAEKIEATPKLSKTYQKYKSRISLWQPWVWAVIFSIPGIILLNTIQVAPFSDIHLFLGELRKFDINQIIVPLLSWILFLILVRLTFQVYNYVNKPTRIWVYPVLQIYKCFGFLILTTTNLTGSMLFASQSISRWVIYLIYRYSKGSWNKVGQILRCILFGILIVAVTLGTQGSSIILSWQTGCIFLYATLKSTREFRTIFGQMGLIYDKAKS